MSSSKMILQKLIVTPRCRRRQFIQLHRRHFTTTDNKQVFNTFNFQRAYAERLKPDEVDHAPRVGSDPEYQTLADAGVKLTWLNSEKQDEIYGEYLKLIKDMKSEHNTTSHAYVTKVLAAKYQMSPERVAAIIVSYHKEDQMRREGKHDSIQYKTQEYVDRRIEEHISVAYREYREIPPPIDFVELNDDDNRMTSGGKKGFVAVGDEYDLEKIEKEMKQREEEKLMKAMESQWFVEDKDDRLCPLNVNANAIKFKNRANEFQKKKAKEESESRLVKVNGGGGGGGGKSRWKYVAEIIDTHDKTNKNNTATKYKRKNKGERFNILVVEQGGDVRVATMAELKQCAWGRHLKRNDQLEFTFREAKRAWMDSSQGWGREEIFTPGNLMLDDADDDEAAAALLLDDNKM